MHPTQKELLSSYQISTLEEVLKKALAYHFSNYTNLEKAGEPYSIQDQGGIVDFATRMKANTHIKFELQAYITHLKRFRHFILHFLSKQQLNAPLDTNLLDTWNSLVNENGVINVLANKWVSHRSIDYPRKEDSDSLHLSVLLNLEQVITMWDNGHFFVSFEKYTFNLSKEHSNILAFTEWVFKELASNRKVESQI